MAYRIWLRANVAGSFALFPSTHAFALRHERHSLKGHLGDGWMVLFEFLNRMLENKTGFKTSLRPASMTSTSAPGRPSTCR